MSRILVVDDDTGLLVAITRVLERAAHSVATASGGQEAIAAAEREIFDVALVDFQMPEPTGLSVLQHLLARQPGCMRVLISGRLDLPLAIDAVNKGATFRILRKPFSPSALLTVVDECDCERERLRNLLTNAMAESLRAKRGALEECLSGQTLQLAVQPIVGATDGRLAACEGLLRCSHTAFAGPIPLLHAAEQCDMLDDVAAVVVDRAARWLERLPQSVKLFVNLHPLEMRRPDALRRRLSALCGAAERVVLEVTERSSLLEVPAWEASLRMISESGFGIAVDDLGAGYSSLAVLAAIAPDYMKVDMSITRGVNESEQKQRLLELLCRFADSSHARLVAEGVETAEEATTVRRCGAHYVQGYWIARPWQPDPRSRRGASLLPPWLRCAQDERALGTRPARDHVARHLQEPNINRGGNGGTLTR